jgi:hypothetical protein
MANRPSTETGAELPASDRNTKENLRWYARAGRALLRVWTWIKRGLIFLIGTCCVVLGLSASVSALLGYYEVELAIEAMLFLLGLGLAALGGFFLWIATRGSDKDVRETSLLP